MAIAPDQPAAGANRRLLCILGMHRSGTSVTTGLLHHLGARVAPGLVAAIAGVNADGFWEDSRVVQLDEELLQAHGLHWYDLAAPLPGTANGAFRAQAWNQAAHDHFSGSYAAAGTWIVKDPRLCRLLPFWLGPWQAAGLSPFIVHTLRHPYAVARSLLRRDRIPVEYGVVLWLLHTLEAMSHSVDMPGMVMVFEDFLRRPAQLPQILASRYGIEFPVEPARWQEIADATVKAAPGLFEIGLDEAPGLRELMAFAVSVYERLCGFAYDAVDPAVVASLRAELRKLLDQHAAELLMLRRNALELMALSGESVRIGELHSHALAVIQEKDEGIAELGRLIAERDRVIAEKDQVIAEKDQVIAGKDLIVAQMDRVIADRNQIIKDIAYFRFWRLVPRLIRRIKRQ